jgi:hypothetical protein
MVDMLPREAGVCGENELADAELTEREGPPASVLWESDFTRFCCGMLSTGTVAVAIMAPNVAADGLRFLGVDIGVVLGDIDWRAACAKKVVHVVGVISGPAVSSSRLLVLARRLSVPLRYTEIPVVDGRPNSRAMATSIAPSVACSGMSLPRRHLRLRIRSASASSSGTRDSKRVGGITATT